jgi:hypothetical protein
VKGRRAWWAIFAVVYVAGCLMHLRFSIWLVSPRETSLGRFAFADFVPAVAAAAAILLVAAIVVQLRRARRPWLLAGCWVLWAGAVALNDRFLTFSANEWAHYPQYGLVAWLLARAMDPARERRCAGRILFWVALLGAADELLQYRWITASYSDYFDFNDCVANVLGGAGGLLLHYGSAQGAVREVRPGWPRAEAAVLATVAFVVASGFATGYVALSPVATVRVPPGGVAVLADGTSRLYLQRRPSHYGSWQAGPRWSRYYVLPPMVSLLIMLSSGVLFAGLMMVTGAPGSEGRRDTDAHPAEG